MKSFEIISSNPNQTGGFVTKLSCETKQETVFGTKTKKETYYVSGTKQLKVGDSINLDINDWRVQEYPFTNPDTGEITQLKWLHLK